MTDWDKIHRWLIYTIVALGIIGWGVMIAMWVAP